MNTPSVINKVCFALLPLCLLINSAHASQELVQKAKVEQTQQKNHDAARKSGFALTESSYLEQKKSLESQRRQLQEETEKLAKQFSQNEQSLAKSEEQLRLDTGSLGELFGVVRQSAKELQAELSHSITSIDRGAYDSVVDDIVDAKALPSMAQLTGLWQSMNEQIQASSEQAEVSIRYIEGDGIANDVSAYRLGAMGLVGEQGYLNWSGQKNGEVSFAVDYPRQPQNAPTVDLLSQSTDGLAIYSVDPSRGIMLDQLALTPSLKDRLQAGGAVGKVIMALLAFGLIIAIFRGVKLAISHHQIQKQLKTPETPKNNPLGRVLAVYNQEQSRSVESLELRLLEAVVDEQQVLEKGLSMLKLLAALAPMLGLLGTVTGMIETFQVITQFGNGDPKVMAGGISMALITTVLGLVAAMPLLLAHNILSTQAENIRNILEKQGIGLVATQAEKKALLVNDSSTETAA
ncbi:flagellar motor protein MotA [Vibrio sp. 10N.286.49.B3]|uniref:MotA/TolQ/ExbB proton channel family protein n=1 Tax=Vibrio sp. 10N.286.49.B3 TaxID=1880855 RepID=UPI000C82723A|nr:MotA/TolQ/ExbB proton channel family protein [Vibrio sp. 10N.286.49.B3]PMH46121.1 flagellar motor protein MotA [Vibrio sp. 10N.286.49.B3]